MFRHHHRPDLQPRRQLTRMQTTRPAKRQHNVPSFRSRRTTPPSAQGRWTLLPQPDALMTDATQWSAAIANQLLNRYGVLTRESIGQENLPGGFSAVYDTLKVLEESGRIRRGYFVAGLGATQFALPSAVDLLRSLRNNVRPEKPEMVILAATDPANVYGSVLRWPQAGEANANDAESQGAESKQMETTPRMLSRSVGANVILRNGELVAYVRRNNPNVQVFLPMDEPERSQAARDLAQFLAHTGQEEMRRREADHRSGMLITTINGMPIAAHWMARALQDAGFQPAPIGFNLRRVLMPVSAAATEETSQPITEVQ